MKRYYSQDFIIKYKDDDKKGFLYEDASYEFRKRQGTEQRDFLYVCVHTETFARHAISFIETVKFFTINGISYSKDVYTYQKSDDKRDLFLIKRYMIPIDDNFENVEMIYRAI